MKRARSPYCHSFPFRLMLMLMLLFLLTIDVMDSSNNFQTFKRNAYGHLVDIPGAQTNATSKTVGSYDILFQNIPPQLWDSDNSSLLRFSITQNNQDTYNVFAALKIKENSTGKVDAQFPYKFYGFGDINFRHSFDSTDNHEVILQARIAGDQQYQSNPLVASFPIPVINLEVGRIVVIIVVLTLIALPVGILILILDFNRRMKRKPISE